MDRNDKRNQSGGMFGRTDDQFQVRSATSGVTWDFSDITSPPDAPYVGVDDQLQVMVFTDAASIVTINVRMLGLDGLIHPLQFAPTAVTVNGSNRFRFQLMEGWILSACMFTAQGGVSNQYTYAQVALARAPFGNNTDYLVLCAGFCGQFFPLAFPGSPVVRGTDGAGVMRLITQAAPAAGADLVITVPNLTRWRVVSFRATLVTAVAAANRTVSLTYQTGANVAMESVSNFTQAASITNTYNFWDSAQFVNAPFNLRTEAPLPSNMFLAPGQTVNTVTTGIQAADQWSAGLLSVMEWPDNY